MADRLGEKVALVLFFSFVATVLGCGEYRKAKHAEIYVGSPEVLSRERLVNDRLAEDEWLRKRLEESDNAVFGNQGIVDVRSFLGLSVQADVTVDALIEANQAAELAAIEREQEIAGLDHRIDRLKKLQELRDLRQKPSSDTDPPADGWPALDESNNPPQTQPDSQGGGDGKQGTGEGGTGPKDQEMAPKDQGNTPDGGGKAKDQDEDDRDADLGTTLDRYLDRLSESSNLLPDPADAQETGAKPSPIEEFRDHQAYREEIRNAIFENALDDRHDLEGGTLYRLNFDATILPPKGLEAWAVVEVCVEKVGKKACSATLTEKKRQKKNKKKSQKGGASDCPGAAVPETNPGSDCPEGADSTSQATAPPSLPTLLEQVRSGACEEACMQDLPTEIRAFLESYRYLTGQHWRGQDLSKRAARACLDDEHRSRLQVAGRLAQSVQDSTTIERLEDLLDLFDPEDFVGDRRSSEAERLETAAHRVQRLLESSSATHGAKCLPFEHAWRLENLRRAAAAASDAPAAEGSETEFLHARWLEQMERDLNRFLQARRERAWGCEEGCPREELLDRTRLSGSALFRELQGSFDLPPAEFHVESLPPPPAAPAALGKAACAEETPSCGLTPEEMLSLITHAFTHGLCTAAAPSDETWARLRLGLAVTPKEAARSFPRVVACVANTRCGGPGNALDYLLVDQLRSEYLERLGLRDYLSIAEPACGDPRLRVLSTPAQNPNLFFERQRFARALAERERVYAYASTPKESVQRISEVAAHASSFQAALSLGVVAGKVKAKTAAQLIRETQSLAQGLERKPLVVGYTQAPDGTLTDRGVARAGWILGPKFDLEPGRHPLYHFEHIPVQNTVSAVVAVPSWWEEAQVTTRTSWKGTGGRELGEPQIVQHTIDLPGQIRNVTDTLTLYRDPVVFEFNHWDVKQGVRADLLIDGWNLWRSTKVTLGGQVSSSIRVLPNMGGIVATFDRITEAVLPDGKKRENVALYVWTSEGYTVGGEVTIHPGEPNKPESLKLALLKPRIIQGTPVELKVTQGELPKMRSGLRLALRRWHAGAYEAPQLLEVGYVEATKSLKSKGVPDLGDDGDPVRIALEVTLKDLGDVETTAANRLAAFYESADAAKVEVRAPAKVAGPFDLIAPRSAPLAFPGFGPDSAVAIEATRTLAGKVTQEIWTFETTRWQEQANGTFRLQSKLLGPGGKPPTRANGEKIAVVFALTNVKDLSFQACPKCTFK
jgi:hypothetical protein